jgi:flavodoxin
VIYVNSTIPLDWFNKSITLETQHMKALVVFDSVYGNTAKIAAEVSRAVEEKYTTSLVPVVQDETISFEGVDLLIVGSPTQGGRATVPIQEFIAALPNLERLPVAVFDTRFTPKEHGIGLRLIMKAVGFAADKMANDLMENGGALVTSPEGFIVRDKTGPLDDGELRRAYDWGKHLLSVLPGKYLTKK